MVEASGVAIYLLVLVAVVLQAHDPELPHKTPVDAPLFRGSWANIADVNGGMPCAALGVVERTVHGFQIITW